MDIMIGRIEGFGEYGIDTEASLGSGRFYVRVYGGVFDACGYDSEQEASEELEYLSTLVA